MPEYFTGRDRGWNLKSDLSGITSRQERSYGCCERQVVRRLVRRFRIWITKMCTAVSVYRLALILSGPTTSKKNSAPATPWIRNRELFISLHGSSLLNKLKTTASFERR